MDELIPTDNTTYQIICRKFSMFVAIDKIRNKEINLAT